MNILCIDISHLSDLYTRHPHTSFAVFYQARVSLRCVSYSVSCVLLEQDALDRLAHTEAMLKSTKDDLKSVGTALDEANREKAAALEEINRLKAEIAR